MSARLFLCLGLLSYAVSLHAQTQTNIAAKRVNATLVSVGYEVQFPLADMAQRFGVNSNINGSLLFKFGNNWLLGGEAGFLFGGGVKEDTMFNYLYTKDGNLIGTDGLYDGIILYERGYDVFLKGGKLLPAFHSNPNSGLMVQGGIGFLQHKIKVDDIFKELPYVGGEYAKGYDRLTNGLAISQSIGYLHLDPRRFLNYSVGIEATEAFTQNRRSWNFDQMRQDTSKRLDILIGLKINIYLPFYGRGEERIYTD